MAQRSLCGPTSRPLPTPTHYPPGTDGKIDVLTQRYALGLELHHPNDCRTFARGAAVVAPRSDARFTTMPPGVRPRGSKFLAESTGHKSRYLGLFTTLEEAAAAVERAREVLGVGTRRGMRGRRLSA